MGQDGEMKWKTETGSIESLGEKNPQINYSLVLLMSVCHTHTPVFS